jgi:2-oxoglutarate dehydrogenase E2 component (dihydrolipoamide succinyltransferase)
MPVDITVPSVGESITEGVIVRWLKQNGESIRRDEPLFELETEKATTEIPSPASGVVQITVPAGKKVQVGGVVGHIEEGAAKQEVIAAKRQAEPPAKPQEAEPMPQARAPAKQQAAQAEPEAAPPMSPAARIHVAEKRIDPRQIAPSGRGGVIVKDDVLRHEDGQAVPAPALQQAPRTQAERVTRQPMSPLRRRIAQRLLASRHETATLTTFNEADLSAIIELRNRFKDSFKEKHGVSLGFMSFFVKATVEALKAFPIVNSEIEGDDVVTHHEFHIGVAVSSDRGLMVPVLRDCDQLSFAEIEKTIANLAAKARDGKIRPDDLTGGTFTITNGGIFGSMMSTPILNPPQSGILGMHAIQKRPVAVGDQVVIRPMMYLALSYDHRLIDGREAVLFLMRIKECVEHPERILLEM